MFYPLQLLCLGAAAVIDTVLLLVLLERRNRQFVRVPLIVMVGGAWLLHAGLFCSLLLTDFSGAVAWELQWSFLLVVILGLFLMPCGMMHAAVRLSRTGIAVLPRAHAWHLLCYLPLVACVPLAFHLAPPPADRLLAPLLPFAPPYLFWGGLVKLGTAWVLLRAHGWTTESHERRFFAQMAGCLLAMTVAETVIFAALLPLWPDAAPYLLLAAVLTPLAPILLLGYFVLRYNFMQLMLERTLVYGGIVAGVLLSHQVAFQGLSAALPERYRLPFVMLEAIALVALVLLYQPLRQRSAEGLRYLLGRRVAHERERLRRLAAELTARAGQAPQALLDWFTRSLREALEVDYAAGWLFFSSGEIRVRCGDSDRVSDEQVGLLRGRMKAADIVMCSSTAAATPTLAETLRAAGASLAVLKSHQKVSGLLLLGRRRGNLELGEESVNAVLLLVEQLAITADNSILQAEQQAATRRALRNEKLSALGLLAGSIAHEVKNPLSAIKTIATVMAEDLGPESPHTEGLRLIVGEVDRLASSTTQILDFARTGPVRGAHACVAKAVLGTLHVLGHLARQRGIAIETRVEDDLPEVRGDEASLREVFFNLVANSLDAAGRGGRVSVGCWRENGCVVAEVRDSGPGIPPEVQSRLFEPFHTTKPDGTGLGLYVVGRNVSELGGEIRVTSSTEGTAFVVKLRIGEDGVVG